MSVLRILQSNKKTFRNSIMLMLSLSIFACQNADKQQNDTVQVNGDALLTQSEAKVDTQESSALPIVQMIPAERTKKGHKEDTVEVFQLEVVAQTVITPAQRATAKEDATIVEVKAVEQTKQTQQQAIPDKKEQSKPAVQANASTNTATASRTNRTTVPRNSDRDRITTRGLLSTPMWVVIMETTDSEAEAIRTSSQYFSLGFNSNYYWAPDYEENGEKVFRVFLGPFPNQQLAEQFLNEKKDPNLKIIYLQ